MGNVGLLEFLLLGAVLISIGVYGVLSRRNVITLVLALEIMFAGVNLSLAAIAYFTGTIQGVTLIFFVMAIAACETVLLLTLALLLSKQRATTDIHMLNTLQD